MLGSGLCGLALAQELCTREPCLPRTDPVRALPASGEGTTLGIGRSCHRACCRRGHRACWRVYALAPAPAPAPARPGPARPSKEAAPGRLWDDTQWPAALHRPDPKSWVGLRLPLRGAAERGRLARGCRRAGLQGEAVCWGAPAARGCKERQVVGELPLRAEVLLFSEKKILKAAALAKREKALANKRANIDKAEDELKVLQSRSRGFWCTVKGCRQFRHTKKMMDLHQSDKTKCPAASTQVGPAGFVWWQGVLKHVL